MINYTPLLLPPFIVGSQNKIAVPKKGVDVVVCMAPSDASLARPASWGLGQALEIKKGSAHIAQDGEGDSYPNLEFDKFYEMGKEVSALNDARAKYLVDFWDNHGGHQVKVFLATKTRHAVIVGKVQGVEGVFVNHEGTSTFDKENGGYILQSPLDATVMWYVTNDVFQKKYD
jgi:hypothetical protein